MVMTLTQPTLAIGSPPSMSVQEIDVELFTFVERYATNLTRWDLLVYFGQHPSMRSDASQVAKHIGRTPRSIQKELEDLVYLGVLRANRNDGSIQYGLTRSTTTRRAVVRLARDYTSRCV